jgi:hypothetical protein
MSEVKRLYFADILRVLVILSLIPFHAAITYTGHGDVYVYDPAVVSHYLNRTAAPGITSVPLDRFVDLLDNFFMRLLFAVSGIAAFFSLLPLAAIFSGTHAPSQSQSAAGISFDRPVYRSSPGPRPGRGSGAWE